MNYITQSLSLAFWLRLQFRLEQTFAEGLDKLAAIRRRTVQADIDTSEMARSRAESERNEALQFLAQMEDIQSLLMAIGGQTRFASFESGLMQLEQRIRGFKAVSDMFNSLGNQPRRSPIEEDLASAEKRYASLRMAGQGENINADRARLRDYQVALPVLGDEDVQPHLSAARNLVTQLDNLEARAQAMRTTLMMALRVPEELTGVLQSFGVEVYLDAQPAIDGEAPAIDAEAAALPSGELALPQEGAAQ